MDTITLFNVFDDPLSFFFAVHMLEALYKSSPSVLQDHPMLATDQHKGSSLQKVSDCFPVLFNKSMNVFFLSSLRKAYKSPGLVVLRHAFHLRPIVKVVVRVSGSEEQQVFARVLKDPMHQNRPDRRKACASSNKNNW